YRGKTVELGGGGEFSWGELVDFMLDTTDRAPYIKVERMDLGTAKFYAGILEQFPDPFWTVDEVIAVQMTTDVVVKPDTTALTIGDFDVTPQKLEEVGITMLRRFKAVQHFGIVKGYHL
ncbi:unnamed protein product, partial [Sphacelaria rigidula]